MKPVSPTVGLTSTVPPFLPSVDNSLTITPPSEGGKEEPGETGYGQTISLRRASTRLECLLASSARPRAASTSRRDLTNGSQLNHLSLDYLKVGREQTLG